VHDIDLDMGRLFQGLWLDPYEELMPHIMEASKNLVCVACKLAERIRAAALCFPPGK
jgi:hypothetical protein